jgi:sugar phosphate isomerase/epimerase
VASIGFSTGALALSDVETALDWLRGTRADGVELSALRLPELAPLVESVGALDLTQYRFVSVHAPGRIPASEESRVVRLLQEFAERKWPIVLHPDAISNVAIWDDLGPNLLLENMDKRKQTGRTVEELDQLFRQLPDARLCFDIAHARQVDGTMIEAYRILKKFGDRIAEIHISEVTSSSGHDRISPSASRAFQKVAELIPRGIPVIIESRIPREEIGKEIDRAEAALTPLATTHLAA